MVDASAQAVVCVGRRYRLSASHRLYRPEWDAALNEAVFGKCANPHGHGHNYAVDVQVTGPVDAVTGMVMDLVELDRIVMREVVEPFDHCNLNLHAALAGSVPTSENVCVAMYERLKAALPAGTLWQVRLEETANNAFTYRGAGRGSEAGRTGRHDD